MEMKGLKKIKSVINVACIIWTYILKIKKNFGSHIGVQNKTFTDLA